MLPDGSCLEASGFFFIDSSCESSWVSRFADWLGFAVIANVEQGLLFDVTDLGSIFIRVPFLDSSKIPRLLFHSFWVRSIELEG